MGGASTVRRWSRRLLVGAALATIAALLAPAGPGVRRAARRVRLGCAPDSAPAEAPDRDVPDRRDDQARAAGGAAAAVAGGRRAPGPGAGGRRGPGWPPRPPASGRRRPGAATANRTGWSSCAPGPIDLVTDGRLTRRVPGFGGAPTLRTLDRALPDSWLRITGGRADLAAAVLLTPGVTLTLGADLPTVAAARRPAGSRCGHDLHRRRPAGPARDHRRLARPADRGPVAGRPGPAVRRGVGRWRHRVHRLDPHRSRHGPAIPAGGPGCRWGPAAPVRWRAPRCCATASASSSTAPIGFGWTG